MITRVFCAVLIACAAQSFGAANELPEPKAGGVVAIGQHRAVVKVYESLPLITNEYSARFRFDAHENPKLTELRERYKIDEVIAPGTDEFSRQLLLMEWVHNRFKKFGAPTSGARGALKILEGIEKGETFFCTHYAHLMVSAAASVGWVNRELALRRHQGVNAVGGSTEHATTEIWSNQHGKWVMLDPTSNLHVQKEGTPLNAFEIRQEWFYHGGTNLTFVIGSAQQKYRKSDLPILLKRFAGFGDLAIHPDELDKYGFIGYIPNTDLLDSGEDYGKMFITKDALCDGTQWHTRKNPANPAVEPYFPLGQSALRLGAGENGLKVEARTLTPNFDRFETRLANGEWKPSAEAFDWSLAPGVNELQVRAVNKFGVAGPAARLVVEWAVHR